MVYTLLSLLKRGMGRACHVSGTVSMLVVVSILCITQANAAVAPSLYTNPDNYRTVQDGGQVQWATIKNDDSPGSGCPGDTKPELPVGRIIKPLIESGYFGLAQALAELAFAGTISGIGVYVLDGIRVACPPRHPDHPDIGAYWTHFGTKTNSDGSQEPKSKIVFAYRPCVGFPVADSDGGDSFKDVKSGLKCPSPGFRIGDGEGTVREWEGGRVEYVNGVVLGTKELEDKICLYMEAGLFKLELVCQYKKPPEPPTIPQLACFMPKVCAASNAISDSKTQLPFSISATLVRCLEGTMAALFNEDSPLDDPVLSQLYNPSPLGVCPVRSFTEKFRLIMHSAVTGLLTLFIVFYGLKIAFGMQMPQRREFYMKLFTFALVSYFALGEGWKEYFPALVNLTNGLAANIMDTTTAGGRYCEFPSSLYEAGFEHNRLWDTLDCKIMTYFFSNEDYPKLIYVGAYSFLGGGILILLFGIIFAIFLVLILIFTINIYISAFLATSILVFLSPIFVPLALFGPTKSYFDEWLDEIIGFAIYPVVLFGFVALMLVSFDTFMFNEKVHRNADGDVVFDNPLNEWIDNDVGKAVCNLRDRNPMILEEYTATTTPPASALSNCQNDCWMYEAKLVDPGVAGGTSIPDCDGLASYAPAPGGPQPVVALCRTTGTCIEGDYKPKFRYFCNATGKRYDSESQCHAAEVCPSGVLPGSPNCTHPCGPSDCDPLCDTDGFGCQLYRARISGGGSTPTISVDRFDMAAALLALLKVLGIGILFFYFLSIIGPLVAQLTGNRKSSLAATAINPHKIMKDGANKIIAAATKGASKGVKKMKDEVKRPKGGESEGESSGGSGGAGGGGGGGGGGKGAGAGGGGGG